MTDYKQIYQTQAEQYEYLVAHEDYEGNILRALLGIRPLANTIIVELGAGTGRLTRLLAPLARQIVACDIAQPMLEVARQKLQQAGRHNWQTVVCDNRAVAVAGATADVAIIGWSLGHFISWYAGNWRDEIGRCLAEMSRTLRPGGTMIILETLGTNQRTPTPPSPGLAVYYQWLEQEQGFQSAWIRTDYQYPTVAEAVASIRFFFGEAMADNVARTNSPIVPECTGLWWRRSDKSL
jgi:ubiquinone/menaquinone biosynthesis C-methylase UbiE